MHFLWLQYAVIGGLDAAVISAGSFDTLSMHNAASASLTMALECLEVVSRRGVVLLQYTEAASLLTNSLPRRWIYEWVVARMFSHDEHTKRCPAHAFGDPTEVKISSGDLLGTVQGLGVSMPVMESYVGSIVRLAPTVDKDRPANIPR